MNLLGRLLVVALMPAVIVAFVFWFLVIAVTVSVFLFVDSLFEATPDGPLSQKQHHSPPG